MSPTLLILTDEAMLLHEATAGHPERPARLRTAIEAVKQLTDLPLRLAAPSPASREHLCRVHDHRYIDEIEALRDRSARLDADTAVSPHSVAAAYLAAGAAVESVNAVCSPRHTAALALVRPPGHHAERDRAMGFCLFNNIAVAAAHAIVEHGLQRVLIVDWDVHHGNGTQHMFELRRDVLFFSSHQSPLYPGTGALSETGIGEGEGFTVNAPVPAGFDDAAMVSLYRQLLIPIADAFKPELVLVSAGFDAHGEDPLGGLRMTDAGFGSLCGIVRDLAAKHCDGRLALILEGGYSLNALRSSLTSCIRVLCGDVPAMSSLPDANSARTIDEICTFHRRFWPI